VKSVNASPPSNEPSPPARSGRSNVAARLSESGSISARKRSIGRTHSVTIRPSESKLTVVHSPTWNVELVSGSRPSGPAHVFVSLMYASAWIEERPFGAMNGCWGTRGTSIGRGVAGAPM
jgi:hypothetical protein